jgi:hypothetical protein
MPLTMPTIILGETPSLWETVKALLSFPPSTLRRCAPQDVELMPEQKDFGDAVAKCIEEIVFSVAVPTTGF